MKLDPHEKEILEKIVQLYDCTYAGKGSISGLLSKIAQQNLMVVPTPLYLPYTQQNIYTNKQEVDATLEIGSSSLTDTVQEDLDRIC